MAISAPSITNENRNGGLWNNKIAKSVTNRLANMGWSRKALRIFVNMAISSGTREGAGIK